MDLVLRLRELRRRRGLRQHEVARRSGVGQKMLSAYETGDRIDSLKVRELAALCNVYGVTLSQFFSDELAHELAPWDRQEAREAHA